MRNAGAVFAVMLLALGCGGEPDAESSLSERSFRDVMEKADEDEYDPPADGKITEAQLDMYLEVREHEKAVAEAARQKLEETAEQLKGEERSVKGFLEGIKGMGNVADYLTADIRAAQDLGYNTAEYRWVKEAISEAVFAEMSRRARQRFSSQMEENREQLEQQLAEAETDAQRKIYEGMLAAFDESGTDVDDVEMSDAVRHNLALLERREDVVETVAKELGRWGADVTSDELRETYGNE